MNDGRNFFAPQIEGAGRSYRRRHSSPGIRFADSGSVSNVNVFDLEKGIGRFTTGMASLLNTHGMREYGDQLITAITIETLLVQRTEVGSTEVGPSRRGQSKRTRPSPTSVSSMFRQVRPAVLATPSGRCVHQPDLEAAAFTGWRRL